MEKNFVFKCYTYENGMHNGFIIVKGLKKLAEFIVSNENDKVITDIGDQLIIKTIGSFLDVVPNQQFRLEFLPYLLKAQGYEDIDEEMKKEKTMRKFTENLEQGYKNIEWELELGGAIPAELLLDRDELDWTLQSICETIAYDIIQSPDNLEDGLYYTMRDGIDITFIIHGWDSLSFGAQSVLIYDIADALNEGNYADLTTVADFFDEDD